MKTKKRNILYFIIPTAFVIGFWFWGWHNLGNNYDVFNALTALFSGLAFAGLIFTIYQQQIELGLQREELAQTREELHGQKVQLELQNKHFAQQNFETTLFNMLTTQRQIIEEMEYSETIRHSVGYLVSERMSKNSNPPTIEVILYKNRKLLKKITSELKTLYIFNESHVGRVFERINIYGDILSILDELNISNNINIKPIVEKYGEEIIGIPDLKTIKENVDDWGWTFFSFKTIFYYYLSYYDNYFSHFYKILEFIKENEDGEIPFDFDHIDNIELKYQKYVDIILSQMSSSELIIMFYYFVLNRETNDLVKYYKIFEKINKDLLLDPSHINFL